jgi:hypothetical protein
MRTAILSVVLVGVAACATPRPQPEPPKSASEHLREAARHEQEAAAHERAAAEAARSGYEGYACGDRALSDQTQTGGEPVTRWVPCWSVERDASAAHRAEAERLRAEARAHRATARTLVDVERTFCAIMPEDELTHTPFYHRTDVASVEPYREGDALAGAQHHLPRGPRPHGRVDARGAPVSPRAGRVARLPRDVHALRPDHAARHPPGGRDRGRRRGGDRARRRRRHRGGGVVAGPGLAPVT